MRDVSLLGFVNTFSLKHIHLYPLIQDVPYPRRTWAEKAWVCNLLLPVQHLKIPRLSPELTASFFLLLPFPDSSFSNFTAEETPAVFL